MASRVGAGRSSHLRADKARPLVTDVLQGGSDVNLLHSWGQGAQGRSGGVQRRIRPRKSGTSWGRRLGGLGEARAWASGTVGKVLTFCHAVQYHVDEDVGASPPCTVAETGEEDRLSSAQDPAERERWRRHCWSHSGWLGEGVSELRVSEGPQHLGPQELSLELAACDPRVSLGLWADKKGEPWLSPGVEAAGGNRNVFPVSGQAFVQPFFCVNGQMVNIFNSVGIV